MAGFDTIGSRPGDAAPGEYSAGALLTASGLVIMRDPTTLLPSAKYPPGYLLADNAGTSYSNSASETGVLSGGAIASCYPAGVAVGDMVKVRAAGTWLNNSGGTQTLTLNLYMGTTIIATAVSNSLAANATVRAWMLDIEVRYSILGGAGAGAVNPTGVIGVGTGTGTGFQSVAAVADFYYGSGAAVTLATNAAANLDLKAQTSNGTATTTVACNLLQARWFPKNY